MLNYEITKKDIIKAFKANEKSAFWVLNKFYFFIILVAVGTIIYVFSDINGNKRVSYFIFPIIFILFIASFFNIVSRIRYYLSIKSYGINPKLISHHNFTLNPNGFSLSYENLFFQIPYLLTTKVVYGKEYIVIYSGINIFEIIPLSVFGTINEKEAFINDLKNRIQSARTGQNDTIANNDLNISDEYKYCFKFMPNENEVMDTALKGTREILKTKSYWSIGRILLILISILLIFFGISIVFSSKTYDIKRYSTPTTFVFILIIGIVALFYGVLSYYDILMIFSPINKMITKMQLKNQLNRRYMLGIQAVCIAQDKISLYRTGSRYDFQKDYICKTLADKDHLYIFLKNKIFFAIPISAFDLPSQVNEVIGYLNIKQ